MTVVARLGRWFMESRACRWARSMRDTGADLARDVPPVAVAGTGVVEDQRGLGVGELVVAPDGDRWHRAAGAGAGTGRSGRGRRRRAAGSSGAPPGSTAARSSGPTTLTGRASAGGRTGARGSRGPSGSSAPNRGRCPGPAEDQDDPHGHGDHDHGCQDDPHPDYSTRSGASREARPVPGPAAGPRGATGPRSLFVNRAPL